MRLITQRVSEASVTVDGETVGICQHGWLVLLGIAGTDTKELVAPMLEKLIQLRAFSDEQGKMNKSLMDINGSLLIVSQFTLYADLKAGRRPSFTKTGKPELAKEIYENFIEAARSLGIHTQHGKFGHHMEVKLCNTGPATFILDSIELFGK